VRETTPDSRPDSVDPGTEEAVTVVVVEGEGCVVYGGPAWGFGGRDIVLEGEEDRALDGAVVVKGVIEGVGGAEEAGDGGWTIHMLVSC
jgi:hypothetical protein